MNAAEADDKYIQISHGTEVMVPLTDEQQLRVTVVKRNGHWFLAFPKTAKTKIVNPVKGSK